MKSKLYFFKFKISITNRYLNALVFVKGNKKRFMCVWTCLQIFSHECIILGHKTKVRNLTWSHSSFINVGGFFGLFMCQPEIYTFTCIRLLDRMFFLTQQPGNTFETKQAIYKQFLLFFRQDGKINGSQIGQWFSVVCFGFFTFFSVFSAAERLN